MIVDTLKVFVTVVEEAHFSRAAEMLHLSQPGVSQHIRNLEKEFGTKLLHRTSKRVKPTQAGELLFRNAKQMLALYEEAKRGIHSLRGEVTGSLHVAASFTIGEYVLPRVLARFAAEYPLVDLQATIANTEQVIQAVQNNRADIGLIEGDAEAEGDITLTPFMQDEMIVIVPRGHSLSRLRRVEPQALQDQVWILRENGSGTRAFSDNLQKEYGIAMRKSYVFSSNQSVKEAVVAGLGIAVLSRHIVHKELESGEVVYVPIGRAPMLRSFTIVRQRGDGDMKVREMFVSKLMEPDHSKASGSEG